uniref:Uncharacterized protein n=1 Tax=Physcomitrium patens TaxID=3218 RepID=A0A7I4B0H2_PHYPA
MDTIKVCVSNLWALQERRYSVVYLTVTRFVRTVMRLILRSTPRYFWWYSTSFRLSFFYACGLLLLRSILFENVGRGWRI